MSLVLDNSITMRWCFGDGKPVDLVYAENVMDALATDTAKVPVIWSLEVVNVLVRAEQHGILRATDSQVFLATLRRLRIETDIVGVEHTLTDTLDVARRYRLSAYDASYLELALREGHPLASLDVDLRKAARRAGVKLFRLP